MITIEITEDLLRYWGACSAGASIARKPLLLTNKATENLTLAKSLIIQGFSYRLEWLSRKIASNQYYYGCLTLAERNYIFDRPRYKQSPKYVARLIAKIVNEAVR